MFRKKLDVTLGKEVYVEASDKNYTLVEKGPNGYYFPYKESNIVPSVSMEPTTYYKEFYNSVRNEKENFVVVISYRSIINEKDIIQAYKCHLGEDKQKSTYFIKYFSPMSKEDIDKDIEPNFAKRINKYSVFSNI